MTIGDGGVLPQHEFGTTIGLLRKMQRTAHRKPGDPVTAANRGTRFQMKQLKVFRDREIANAGAFLHDQARWENPGKADSRGGMNLKTELPLEECAAQVPWQKQGQEHENFFHAAAPSSR